MRKTLTALLLLISVVAMAQESVLLRWNYEKGDSYTIDMKMSQVVGVGLMTAKTNFQMSQNIVDVSGETYSSESKFIKIVVDQSQGGQRTYYDSSDKEAKLDPMGKIIKSTMDPILAATVKIKGNKRGEILETKIEPSIPGADKFADQSTNVVYPENAVKVGDTWTSSKSNQGMKLDITYKVASITKEEVTLEVSGKVSGIGEGNITGNMSLDRSNGIPKQSKMSMGIKAQGQDISISVEATYKKN